MRRRDVLKILGMSVGVSALTARASGQAQATAEGPGWKTAIGLNGFASASRKYRKTFPIWEVLDFAAHSGFDGVELVDGWPAGGYPRADEQERIAALRRLYDPSHFDLMNGSSGRPHEMLKRIGVENIGYVHLTDTDGTLREGGTSKHLPCGDGHANINESLATLRDGGFRGWVMIDAWEIPDPFEACVKGKQAIDRALAT